MDGQIGLKRCLGRFDITVYGVGIIVGAGIYSLLGKAAGVAGGAVWMAYAVAAVVAALTALSYAELSSHFPKSASSYTYAEHAFRKKWLAFVIGWLGIYNMVATAATVSLGFGGYLSEMIGIPAMLLALALLVGITLLNYRGIKESAEANALLTMVEIVGLLIVVALGWNLIGRAGYSYYISPTGGFGGVMTAALLVFFAYLGFENVTNIAEETKDPKRTIPHGILIALGVSTILYILVSVTAVSMVSPEQLAASNAPLAYAAEAVRPGMGTVISLMALVATSTTVLASMIAASRMIWSMSTDGGMPRLLSIVHPVHRTPWVAAIAVSLAVACMASLGKIELVAKLSDFGAFLMFGIVNLTVIVMRYRATASYVRPGIFRMPLNIGRFPVLAGLGLVANMVMLSFFSWEMFLAVSGVLATGCAAYFLMRKMKLISI